MARIYRAVGCVLLLAAAAACDGADNTPKAPAPAPDAKKVDAGTAATLRGKVVLEGTPPANAVLKMASDPACSAAHTISSALLAPSVHEVCM